MGGPGHKKQLLAGQKSSFSYSQQSPAKMDAFSHNGDAEYVADLSTKSTETESFDNSTGSPQASNLVSDDEESSTDSGPGLQIPNNYRSPSRSPPRDTRNSRSKTQENNTDEVEVNDEDRLTMLAKHPNITDEQVRQALIRVQQVKQARQRQREEQQRLDEETVEARDTLAPLPPNVRSFSSSRHITAFPVDSDTGEAWDRQPQHASADGSFDRAWNNMSDPSYQNACTPRKGSMFSRIWRKLSSKINSGAVGNDDSIMSPHDMSISITSDKTPRISNVDHEARAKQSSAQTDNVIRSDKWGRIRQKLFKTKQGLIMLTLVIILLLALIWTMVAAVVMKSGKKQHSTDQEDTSPGLLDFPDFPDIPTSEPTKRNWVPMTSAPQPLPSLPPSSPPTKQPVTLSTTLPDSTQTPTRIPTARPSLRVSESPTAFPTNAPVEPTFSPTINFLNTPPLQRVGESLTGSEANQRFGHSVALNRDGTVLAVGAPSTTVGVMEEAGMVQIFEWNATDLDSLNGSWVPRGLPLLGRNAGDQFGSDVALSADGTILVASEPTFGGPAGASSGNVRAFQYQTNADGSAYIAFGQDIPGTAASDHFGMSIALSGDGKTLVVGAPFHDDGGTTRNVSGQVVVLQYDSTTTLSGTWDPILILKGNDHLDWFGFKVDVDESGRVVCAGAPRNLEVGGFVQCYDLPTNRMLGAKISNNVTPQRHDGNFGYALRVAQSATGNIRVVIGAPRKNAEALNAGMVSVHGYDRNTDAWAKLGDPIFAESPGNGDEFGSAVDFDGEVVTISSPGRGRVDRYTLQSIGGSSSWVPHSSPLVGAVGSTFGYDVQQRGSRLAVGVETTPGDNTGRVNVFQ